MLAKEKRPPKPWYFEEVTERGPQLHQVISSNIRKATNKDIAISEKYHEEHKKCDGTIVVDTPGFAYDIRSCALCGECLGLI